MFIHNLKYTIKTLFKNKVLIFWTFAFPIILGVFFNMAFSNIEKDEALQVSDIAVVDNEEFKEQEVYKEALEELSSEENKDKLFHLGLQWHPEGLNDINTARIFDSLMDNALRYKQKIKK